MKQEAGFLPLFPLPNVVFFPRTFLPLHVFEPRYRQMIQDAKNGDGIVGLVLLKPGWEKNYYGNPPVFSVACMGQIVQIEAFPDGRFNILLEGIARVKVTEIVKEEPYRVATVKVMQDIVVPENLSQMERLARELLSQFEVRPEHLDEYMGELGQLLYEGMPLGTVTDIVAASLRMVVYKKQELLEELDPLRRGRFLMSILSRKLPLFPLKPRESFPFSGRLYIN